MAEPGSGDQLMWPNIPWMAGLVAAPLLLGSVTAVGQAVVGLLFAASLLLLSPQLGRGHPRWGRPLWLWLLLGGLAFTMLPLPPSVLEWLSPARAELARSCALPDVGKWQTLSVSPAGTLSRWWELLLIATCFCLSRHAARQPKMPLIFAGFVAAGVLLLSASEIWLQLSDRRQILGLWENRWPTTAGTFPNRNHFANWLGVGALLLLGWLLRTAWPLHSARGEQTPTPPRRWPAVLALGALILTALALLAACGSRAGSLGFGCGLLALAGLVALRSRRRHRLLALAGAGLVVVIAMLAAGGLVLDRISGGTDDLVFKLQIWRQTLAMASQFPLFGIGLGAFAPAFNHYKTFRGDLTFWHAENEWVQLVAEVGVIGVILLAVPVFGVLRGLWRAARHASLPEPELFFGALAGLIAFAAHATFEFVFQIPANALLAAGLLGLVIGLAERERLPVVLPPAAGRRLLLNWLWGLALLGLAAAQGLAWWHGQQAAQARSMEARIAHATRAVALWPMAGDRHISLLRAEVRRLQALPRPSQLKAAAPVRAAFLRGLRLDPFNWEMALELAWFDLAFHPDAQLAEQEARQVVRLNPLQPEIPLRFARHFGARNPAAALGFLESVKSADPKIQRQILDIVWQGDQRPATLWSVTPDTPEGLLALADFALQRGLNQLAVQACQQLSNRVDGALLAQRYLQAGAIAQATNALALAADQPAAQLLAARLAARTGQPRLAIRLAEQLWRASHLAREIERPFPDARSGAPGALAPPTLAALREAYAARTDQAGLAHQLAEAVFAEPAASRDLPLLRQLAARFPRELRYVWMVMQTEWERDDLPAAADTAVKLAEAVQRLR